MSAPLSSHAEPPRDRYLEAAEEEWDNMSLGEKCEAIDDYAIGDVAGRVWLEDWGQYPDRDTFIRLRDSGGLHTADALLGTLDVLHELCRDHPGFTGWLDRKAAQLRQLAEEPEWEED